MTPGFDVQRALERMEERILKDNQDLRDDVRSALISQAQLTGRIDNLEEKAGWLVRGFGTLFAGAILFIWHMVTGKP